MAVDGGIRWIADLTGYEENQSNKSLDSADFADRRLLIGLLVFIIRKRNCQKCSG
jgi:hypothetical protein